MEYYSSIVEFLTSIFEDLVHENKKKTVFLTENPFITFGTCFRIYDDLNS